jgi:hypothetical protein
MVYDASGLGCFTRIAGSCMRALLVTQAGVAISGTSCVLCMCHMMCMYAAGAGHVPRWQHSRVQGLAAAKQAFGDDGCGVS